MASAAPTASGQGTHTAALADSAVLIESCY